ncbi:Uncharacterized protein Rs2_32783 [Raphanus sativus]|nr:Uncharacterized protein Rs2_32780 [Raphanus sativus]KAJ4882690.1 Uncharacterized protein Rs2_32783 [Raphanus sativus]
MTNVSVFLSDLQIGCSSSTVKVCLLRLGEAMLGISAVVESSRQWICFSGLSVLFINKVILPDASPVLNQYYLQSIFDEIRKYVYLNTCVEGTISMMRTKKMVLRESSVKRYCKKKLITVTSPESAD